MFIKRGEGKILSVIEGDEETAKQKTGFKTAEVDSRKADSNVVVVEPKKTGGE